MGLIAIPLKSLQVKDLLKQSLDFGCTIDLRGLQISVYSVKTRIFACPLFCEFRDLGDFAKITGRKNYLKSHCTIAIVFAQQAKTPKLRAPK